MIEALYPRTDNFPHPPNVKVLPEMWPQCGARRRVSATVVQSLSYFMLQLRGDGLGDFMRSWSKIFDYYMLTWAGVEAYITRTRRARPRDGAMARL